MHRDFRNLSGQGLPESFILLFNWQNLFATSISGLFLSRPADNYFYYQSITTQPEEALIWWCSYMETLLGIPLPVSPIGNEGKL